MSPRRYNLRPAPPPRMPDPHPQGPAGAAREMDERSRVANAQWRRDAVHEVERKAIHDAAEWEWRNIDILREAGVDTRSSRLPPPLTQEVRIALGDLGLRANVDRESVHVAHRALIRPVHPDSGGDVTLAARINAARGVVLSWLDWVKR